MATYGHIWQHMATLKIEVYLNCGIHKIMKLILALDISTTCTGYSIWENKKLIDAGAIECKMEDLNERMDHVVSEIEKIVDIKNVETIVAEAALKKFSGGKSTADTMAKLISFNFCLCHILSRKGNSPIPIKRLDVRSARKNAGIIIPKTKNKKEIKDAVIEHWKAQFPNLSWDLKKTGNYKDWVGDMADSITIGASFLKCE